MDTRRFSLTAALASLGLVALVALVGAGPTQAIIYGADDRVEYYELTHPVLQAVADSTVVLMPDNRLFPAGGGGWDIDLFSDGTFGELFELCPTERYVDQPVPGSCSGWLVADDLILTAGHCVETQADCDGTTFVFGFHMLDADTPVDHVDGDDVYACTQIVANVQGGDDDFAIMRMDRPVVGRTPLPVRRDGTVETDAAVAGLFDMGHPAGIPMKIVGGPSPIGTTGLSGGTVKDSFTNYFETNLDVYAGNSGSMVFSVDDNGAFRLVEGILIRGNEDWVAAGQCFVTRVCSEDTGCTGADGDGWEEFTRATRFSQHIPPPCGDGLCEPGESCLQCTDDCGICILTERFEDPGFGQWNVIGPWTIEQPHSAAGYPSSSNPPVASANDCFVCDLETANAFDLSVFNSVTLRFMRFVDSTIDNDDYLTAWFFDGSVWELAQTWTNGTGDTNTWEYENIPLDPALLVPGFKVGFQSRTNMNDEYMQLDDFELVGYAPTGCTDDADCDDGLFCNGVENCDDGTGVCEAGSDPCPGAVCDELIDGCLEACGPVDADTDAVGDGCDCDPVNPGVWRTPTEANAVRLSHDAMTATTTVLWDPPFALGGLFVSYDVLRSTDPGDFANAAITDCVETDDGSDEEATDGDSPAPGGAYHYVVRPRNACPGALGQGPLGGGRIGRPCP